MPYHRLMVTVMVVNLAVLFHHVRRGDWQIADGSALSALSALTLVNVTGAVLVRQQTLLNLLYGLAGRGSPFVAAVGPVEHLQGAPRRRHARRLRGSPVRRGWAPSPASAIVTRVRHPESVTLHDARCCASASSCCCSW